MEPTFKKARLVGTLPEQTLHDKASERLFWKSFERTQILNHNGPWAVVAFSPTNSSKLLVGSSAQVSLHSAVGKKYGNGKKIRKLSDDVHSVAYRSDGCLIAVGGTLGDIFIIDQTSKVVLRTLTGHKASVKGLCFLSNKTQLVSTSDDKTVRLWDVSSGEELWCARVNRDFVRTCSVSSTLGSDLILTGSYDHSVSLWSGSSSEPILTLDHGSPVEAVMFFPGDNIVASAGLSTIKLWDLTNSGRLLREINAHHKTISALSVTQDGKYLLSASLDQSIKVMHVEDFTIVHQFKLPSAIMSLSISADTKRIAAGLSNGTIGVISFFKPKQKSNTTPNTKATYKLATIAQESYVLLKDVVVPLKKFDAQLKSFRYRHALDIAVRRKNAHLLASAIGELIRREGLVAALSGRTEAEIVPLLQLIVRYISSPRHASMLIEAGYAILDMYSSVLGRSEVFDRNIKELRGALDNQIQIQRMLFNLEGEISLLNSCNRLLNTSKGRKVTTIDMI